MLFIALLTAPLGAALASLFVRKSMAVLEWLTLLASAVSLTAASGITYAVVVRGTSGEGAYFSADALVAILIMIIAVVGSAAAWYSTGYLREEVRKQIIGFSRVKQYYILFNLFLMVMFLAVITTSPIIMWIAIEGTTLSTAFLISFYNKPSAMEAAWKYLIINSVGLLLGLFGTLLFFIPLLRSGDSNGLITWQMLLDSAGTSNPLIAKVAFLFLLTGYGTKMGLAPMHTWLPDAHSKAPVPVSSLLSGVLLNVAFFGILRFKAVTDRAVGQAFADNLLMFFGLFSVVVAAFIIFVQKNYKRLLAYSSIEHMGIMALGFGFGGAGPFAALLQMIYHALAKSVLFFSAGNILLKYSSTKMDKVRGVISALPVSGTVFLIGFVVIAGIPPSGIFLTEVSIFSAGILSSPVVAVAALFAVVLVAVGFLRIVASLLFGKKPDSLPGGEAGLRTIIPMIAVLSILVCLSFYVPGPIRSLLQAAAGGR